MHYTLVDIEEEVVRIGLPCPDVLLDSFQDVLPVSWPCFHPVHVLGMVHSHLVVEGRADWGSRIVASLGIAEVGSLAIKVGSRAAEVGSLAAEDSLVTVGNQLEVEILAAAEGSLAVAMGTRAAKGIRATVGTLPTVVDNLVATMADSPSTAALGTILAAPGSLSNQA